MSSGTRKARPLSHRLLVFLVPAALVTTGSLSKGKGGFAALSSLLHKRRSNRPVKRVLQHALKRVLSAASRIVVEPSIDLRQAAAVTRPRRGRVRRHTYISVFLFWALKCPKPPLYTIILRLRDPLVLRS